MQKMDSNVGQILGAIDALGIRNNTVVIFTSDNGPEATWPWQGSSGPWRGFYFTDIEGSLRVPFLIHDWANRWRGHRRTPCAAAKRRASARKS